MLQSKGSPDELAESSNLSMSTNQRHIEFIGLQKKKISSFLDYSSANKKTSPRKRRKKYKSTISTKTSKQDVPGYMKKKKSILKGDSGSSILSDVKKLQDEIVIPKLNLKSLEKESDSRDFSSSRPQSKDQYRSSYKTTPIKVRKIRSPQKRKFRKTDKTEKRLKAGANMPMCLFGSQV